jgi:hypothetical protein
MSQNKLKFLVSVVAVLVESSTYNSKALHEAGWQEGGAGPACGSWTRKGGMQWREPLPRGSGQESGSGQVAQPEAGRLQLPVLSEHLLGTGS